MVSGTYDVFKVDLYDGSVSIDTAQDTIKVALYKSGHTFSAGDSVYTTTEEIDNPTPQVGYTTGGNVLAGQNIGLASNTATFDATDISWTSATFTTAHAVIYDVTNTNSLMHSIDFGGDQSVTAGTFTIVWNAAGISTLA